jgi:hypothetical protein
MAVLVHLGNTEERNGCDRLDNYDAVRDEIPETEIASQAGGGEQWVLLLPSSDAAGEFVVASLL